MQYRYCPKCGTQYPEPQNEKAYKCAHCTYVFYINSKPTVSALIEDGDKILLGIRKLDPAKGKWDIIGGFLEAYEDPKDGVKREALEETGLEVEVIDFVTSTIGEYDYQNEATSVLNLFFRVRVISGTLKPDDDVEALQWFHKDELPAEMAFDGQLEILQQWRDLKQDLKSE